MGAVITGYLNVASKQKVATDCYGNGAILVTDDLVTNLTKFPVGSRYFDLTNRIEYIRKAATAPSGLIGDWCKTGALTVHT